MKGKGGRPAFADHGLGVPLAIHVEPVRRNRIDWPRANRRHHRAARLVNAAVEEQHEALSRASRVMLRKTQPPVEVPHTDHESVLAPNMLGALHAPLLTW